MPRGDSPARIEHLPSTSTSTGPVAGYLVIGSLIFIGWKLVHTRRTTPPAPLGATLVESLRAELNSVRAQSRLLRLVLWWYLLPPTLGVLVATWGMRKNLHAKIPGTLVVIAIDVFVYRAVPTSCNRQAIRVSAPFV